MDTRKWSRRGWLGLAGAWPLAASEGVRHVVVYGEEGRYGGWPANHGIWAWDDEIVVGFTAAYYKPVTSGHATDKDKPYEDWQARSRDGGLTWTIERPAALARTEASDCSKPWDFQHPDFALMFRFAHSSYGPSRFYVSEDRCRNWHGPYRVPGFGQKGIAARTDYLVEGKHQLLAFMSAAKRNGIEGRPFCTRTRDGGRSWDFVSWIAPEPERGYAIMPSTLRLDGGRLLSLIRCKKDGQGWIDAYASDDQGGSWSYLNRAVPDTGSSNPPSLVRLRDGRLCVGYGYRGRPFGIRARMSADQGRTWSEEIVLRRDGSTGDLGYVRTAVRADGRLVSVYYFNGPPTGNARSKRRSGSRRRPRTLGCPQDRGRMDDARQWWRLVNSGRGWGPLPSRRGSEWVGLEGHRSQPPGERKGGAGWSVRRPRVQGFDRNQKLKRNAN